jgi:DNA polymerase-4
LRKIAHIDMDCFFAAVELRDRPDLLGKAVAVGGLPQDRGVISSANYEARKFGVRSALSSSVALRLCPDLVLIPPNFSKYKEASRKIYEIFWQYSDLVEPVSIDEAFIDLTKTKLPFKTATLAAKAIRAQIFLETGLTASAGIAPNPFLAKVASDWHKPNGQFTITPEMVNSFVYQLPLGKVSGVGKVTEKKLLDMGFKTCGDLQVLSLNQMLARFGKWGARLYERCRGIDDRELGKTRERKSLSVEHTFVKDLINIDYGSADLQNLFNELVRRYEKAQVIARGLFVKVKFADFTITTVEDGTISRLEIASFLKLLKKAQSRNNKAIRLVGMGIRIQTANRPEQLELFG